MRNYKKTDKRATLAFYQRFLSLSFSLSLARHSPSAISCRGGELENSKTKTEKGLGKGDRRTIIGCGSYAARLAISASWNESTAVWNGDHVLGPSIAWIRGRVESFD